MSHDASYIRDNIWAALKLRPSFTSTEVAALGVTPDTARKYLRRWEGEGLILCVGKNSLRASVYEHTSDAPKADIKPEIVPTMIGNMWRSMCVLKSFSVPEIAAHSTCGGITVPEAEARSYCRALMDAGYLRPRVKAIPGRRDARYQLVRNTGPNPPAIARVKGVADPNTQEFTVTEEASLWQRF